MHNFNTCQVKSPDNNFNVTDCKTKATNTEITSDGQKNFEGTGSSVTLVYCELKAVPLNILGDYVLLQSESSTLKAIDGLKGSAEKWIYKRTKVQSESHPLNGFFSDYAQLEDSTFVKHAIWSGANRAYQKDVTWAGPIDFTNIVEMHEKGVVYTEVANFTAVNTWAVQNTYNNVVNINESVHFMTDKSSYNDVTNISNSHFADSFTTHASDVNITNSVVDMKATTAPTVNVSSVTMTSHSTTLSELNMSSSTLQSWRGSKGVVNIDGSSTAMFYGTSGTFNTPAKAGISGSPGIIVQAAGSMYKESIGSDQRVWINGTRHERVSGSSLHRIEGNTNWASHGTGTFQSSGPVSLTSPPREPCDWCGGSFSPIPEPPP